MPVRANVGFSSGQDSHAVATEAATASLTGLEKPRLSFVFASVTYDQEKVLEGVRDVVGPDALIVGASTAGEIVGEGPLERHSVVVMTLELVGASVALGVAPVAGDAQAAGQQAAREMRKRLREDPAFAILFPDVLVGDGAAAVAGVLDELGPHFPLVGGAPGDDYQFERTYQYANDRVVSGSVVVVGFAGDVRLGVGVKHGWAPVSRGYRVTRAEGARVYEIEGKPAVWIYEEYLGHERAAQIREDVLAKLAITYPLGFQDPRSSEYIIRDPIRVEEDGSIVCAGAIPEGVEVHIMLGSREDAIAVARLAGKQAREALEGREPHALLIFNCIARKKVLGEAGGEEIRAIREGVGVEVPTAGFYTYGEQAPIDGQVRDIKKCNAAFHNETVVLALLS